MTQLVADAAAPRGARSGPPLPPMPLLGFALAVLAVVLISLFSYRSHQFRATAAERVTQTFEIRQYIAAVFSSLRDAETAQRGFLLTNSDQFLEPYRNAALALPGQLQVLRTLVPDSPSQRERIDILERLAVEKMADIEKTIALRQSGNISDALAIVRAARGNELMNRIRSVVADMDADGRDLLTARKAEWEEAVVSSTYVAWGGSAVLLFLIAAAAVATSRDYRARQTLAWLRTGQMGLSARIQGEQRLDQLGDNVLEFLAEYLDAQVGAVYLAQTDGRFVRTAGYAIPAGSDETLYRPGDGLLGQAAKQNRVLYVQDVPENYVAVGSGLGRHKPRKLLVAPASVDGVVQGVVELGFFHALHPADLELLARVSESLGVALRSSKDRTRLEELLEETQRQAEALQAQQEELRVNNEELEEQGRALKESQVRLETQQAELEQTNTQLEEQTQLLGQQKDELSASEAILVQKAAELERSNQYKSEFLANMSHELRTPLNSSLILSKLLLDNKDGNLTEEQVKFAQTIHSAGNDLLALINDILDLARIEAGKIQLDPQAVSLRGALDALAKSLQPVAQQRGLAFGVTVDPGAPERIETDLQRLNQILKNLLSNAFKFTEKGSVSLQVSAGKGATVLFTVRDTGIGIPAHQQDIIFEAFRQADGSTHRRYGGTGLGLSISQNLARLLGGNITLQSAPGQGSAFTLTLPLACAGQIMDRDVPELPVPVREPDSAATAPGAAPVLSKSAIEDDRDHLTADSRLIMVVEDDVRFAAVLRDLAREMGFQCLVTHSATDAVTAASLYRPSAILLDMNLPDHSGLSVLDQLKHNPELRHIPVHVASVADYTQAALERGAVGYTLKPVKREQLVSALKRLEQKFSQGLRRVLVVEDDERQRESIHLLLANPDVEIVGVENAGSALTQLQASTFDCMVLDLNLPDLSGYELLEQMAGQDGVSFPPVIVYTGRTITREEDQRLRRYSRSIIIKDARSPERLLDEVTLFLHQVESTLPPERQRMLKVARDRDTALEGRRILVVEDDVRNIFALSSLLEPKGAKVEIARNGKEAIGALERSTGQLAAAIDLVLMDIMMPEMDGITAMREIRKRAEWKKIPIIALTAKAMKDDQEKCLAAGANDYIAKPLDVEKLLSLVRVWMPK